MDLPTYYKSNWWKTKSKQIRQQRQKCELCGSRENLHVHHLRYRFFREDDRDVKVMCSDCHLKKTHLHMDELDMLDLDFNHREPPQPATIDHALQIEENRIARRNKVSDRVDYRFLWASMRQRELTTKPLAQFTKDEVSILVECCIDSVLPEHPNNNTIWSDK